MTVSLPTSAAAVGGVLEASWHATSLKKLFPAFFETLQTVAESLDPPLQILKTALQTVAAAQQLFALATTVADVLPLAIDAIVTAAINTAVDQINNFRNTGQAIIIIPPTPGGMKGASRVIRQALLNVRDNQRPDFRPGATVAGWAIIAAADFSSIQKVIDAITLLFTSSDKLSAQLTGVKAKLSLNFPDPFATQKLAGRPAPQNTPAWLRARVIDMIPGGDDLFDNLIAGLKALKPPPFTLPIADYLAFLTKQINRILAILAVVTAIVAILRALFVDIPVKVLEWEAQFGSTKDIADSISPWFATTQPILSDVPDDLYTCGIFSVIGAEDPVSPGAQMAALRLLFLP